MAPPKPTPERRGELSPEDRETLNRWLCVSRIRAAVAIGGFFPVLAFFGLIELGSLTVIGVAAGLVVFSVLGLRASPETLRSPRFLALQNVLDTAAITLGIALATAGTISILARVIYILVIIPASLVSVRMGLGVALMATAGHVLLLELAGGPSLAALGSYEFLIPTFLFFLVAQQCFVYGAHLREKNVALEALAALLAESEKRLAAEGRLAKDLADSARTLSATFDDPEPLTRVVETICDRVRAQWGAMFGLDAASGFRLLAATDPDVASSVDRVELPLASWPAVERLREQRVLVLAGAAGARVPSSIAGARASDVALLAGLYRDGEMIGFLALGFDRSVEDGIEWASHLLAGIAEHASVVLQNARLLEEVRAASELKSEFVGAVSHELRSPLNVVLGYLEMLLDGALGSLNAQQSEVIRHAQANAANLLELIQALLDLNRIEAGRLPLERDIVSLRSLLEEVRRQMAEAYARPAVEVRCVVDPGLQEIETDPAKLKTILRNLLHNALKFTTAGHVTVSATRSSRGRIVIAVEDTGRGIPEDALAYVFDMFRQVPGSGGGGVGLGLHIVRRLADMLGGSIEVESELGVGTRFTLSLPLRAEIEHGQGVAAQDLYD